VDTGMDVKYLFPLMAGYANH